MKSAADPRVTIQAALIEDLRGALLARLQSDGYEIPQALHSDPSSVVECYFTTLRRRLDPRPRRVHVARRLYVPSVASDAYAGILRRIMNGGELGPFMSKGILRPASIDQLLYEWDIHHLHLSERGTGAFAKRSDYVLMVRFTRDDAYLIWVGRHPHGDGWSRAELLHRVHHEWPDSIRTYRARGFMPDDEEPTTDDMVVAMRKVNFLYLFWTADGVGYLPPGGGTMSSGLSANVAFASDRLMNTIQQWQEAYQREPGRLRRLAKEHARAMRGTVRLTLEIDGEEIYARWVEGDIRFRVTTLPTELHST
jgi:hypothetical protein